MINLNFDKFNSFFSKSLQESSYNVDNIKILDNFKPLYTSKAIYNAVYGGRGGGKSIAVADIILKDSFNQQLKDTYFLCFRHYQKSTNNSVFLLLQDRIEYHNLSHKFRILKSDSTITNLETGITILFLGMQNPDSIKSIPNISRAWGEECDVMTKESLNIIIPSFRRTDGGTVKLYFTFNRRLNLDPVLEYINKQSSKLLYKSNIYDLPPDFQNETLLAEAESDKKHDPYLFTHKWLGEPHPDRAIQPFININTVDFDYNIFNKGAIFAFMDPSFMGIDTTAISVGVLHEDKLYVYGVCIYKAWNDCVYEVKELINKLNIMYFAYESNSIGNNPREVYDLQGITVDSRWHNKSKINRIFSVTPYLKEIIFVDSEYDNKVYLNQMRNYTAKISQRPKAGEHDDAPDSLASLMEYMGIIKFG